MLNSLDLTLTLAAAEVQTGRHRHGRGGAGGLSRKRSSRGLFMALLCTERGLGLPSSTRDNTAPCGGCLLPARDPSTSELAAAAGRSSEMTTRNEGVGVGDAHKSEQYLLSFAGSDLSRHLCHVDAKREEAAEGLIALLYDRVNERFPSPDITRIFIALGKDSGGGGGGVRVSQNRNTS